jgi:hypothetical protein
MGRKRIHEIVKCGKCGKPSVLTDIRTRNTKAKNDPWRVYWYWVHTDKVKPRKHYMGPAGWHYPSKDNRKIIDAYEWMADSTIEENKIFGRNLKKFARFLLNFPINDKKAVELINKWKVEITDFREALTRVFNGYNDITKITYESKLTDEEKEELHFEDNIYFATTLIPFRVYLIRCNSLLTDFMDFRTGESKLGWFKMAKNRIIEGDHATASKSGVQTHDGTIRKFTPKQIHDKKIPELELLKSHILKKDIPDKELLKYIDRAIEVLEKDSFAQMLEYIYNYVNPETGYSIKNVHADRRVRLRPKLSESAFGPDTGLFEGL